VAAFHAHFDGFQGEYRKKGEGGDGDQRQLDDDARPDRYIPFQPARRKIEWKNPWSTVSRIAKSSPGGERGSPRESPTAAPGRQEIPARTGLADIDRLFAFFLGGLVIVFAPPMYRLATSSTLPELESAAEISHPPSPVWPAVLFIFGGVFITRSLSAAGSPARSGINSVLKQMLEGGRPEKVTLRRGFFHDTAGTLNHLSRKAAESSEGEAAGKEPGPAAK
jgi:hypothetical protein